MRVRSSSRLNGFMMKSSAPASIAFVFSAPSLAVSMITGNTAVSLVRAKLLADGVAVGLRHHHVEQDEIRLRRYRELQSGVAVVGRDDLVVVSLEDGLQQAHVLGNVVDHENPSGVVGHGMRASQ